MIKSVIRRASLLVLVSALVGAALGSRHQSTALADWEYMCDAWEETCDGSGDPWGGGGGGGGGGSAGWYCPIGVVTVGSKTCTSTGCRAYSPSYPTQVCVFRSSDGQGGCPPLEQCQN
jgi:hypothetical protein